MTPGVHLRDAGTLDGFDQRLRRKRFDQVGNAAGRKRRGTVCRAIITGYIDHRRYDALLSQSSAQLDAGLCAEIDVEDDAHRGVELAMIEQGTRSVEQRGVETVSSQKSVHAGTHGRIVIDDKNGLA